MGNKESVIVRPAFPVHTSRKKEEAKSVSVLTRLPCSFIPWHNLYRLNGWSKENGCRDGCMQKKKAKNYWVIEKGSVSGDCKYYFVDKQGGNRKVNIGWKRRNGFLAEIVGVVVCTSKILNSKEHLLFYKEFSILCIEDWVAA